MDGEWRHGGAPRGAGGWDGTSVNRMIAETAGEPLKLGEARKGFIPGFRGICVTLLTPGFLTLASSILRGHISVVLSHLVCSALLQQLGGK